MTLAFDFHPDARARMQMLANNQTDSEDDSESGNETSSNDKLRAASESGSV